MSDFQSFTGIERAKKRREPPAIKAQRIVANLLTVHLAKRAIVGHDAPIDDEDKARLSMVIRIFKGQHGGENIRPIIHQAFPEWELAKPKLCEHCGEADPTQSHYDAWSDHGDGEGPDGWVCERKPMNEASSAH